MYWKVNFNYQHHCINCCDALIKNNIKIVNKELYDITIKTDISYNDILNICLKYNVSDIKECRFRNWIERNFENGKLRNTSKN